MGAVQRSETQWQATPGAQYGYVPTPCSAQFFIHLLKTRYIGCPVFTQLLVGIEYMET